MHTKEENKMEKYNIKYGNKGEIFFTLFKNRWLCMKQYNSLYLLILCTLSTLGKGNLSFIF